MPVAVEMNFGGMTLDQYDQVLEKMGLTPGGSARPGAISHWVAKTDDGIRVVDVWETREQFDRFAQERIGLLQGSRRRGHAGDALLRRPCLPHRLAGRDSPSVVDDEAAVAGGDRSQSRSAPAVLDQTPKLSGV